MLLILLNYPDNNDDENNDDGDDNSNLKIHKMLNTGNKMSQIKKPETSKSGTESVLIISSLMSEKLETNEIEDKNSLCYITL